MVKTAAIFAFCGALCTAGSKMPFIKQAQAEEVLATSALPFEKAELLPSTTAEGGLSDALAENQEKYLTIVEAWKDRDVHRAHLAAPHMAEFREAVKDLRKGCTVDIVTPVM